MSLTLPNPNLYFLAGAVSVVKMVEETSDIMAARERMIARRFGGANATRTGGVRRKKKNVHKTATSGGLVVDLFATVGLFCSNKQVIQVYQVAKYGRFLQKMPAAFSRMQ